MPKIYRNEIEYTSAPSHLYELQGVTITSPSSGQILAYNGSAWTNTEVNNTNFPNIPKLSVKRLPSISQSATANSNLTTNVSWTGVDRSKVLYSWVFWSNSSNDTPSAPVAYYYDNTNLGCLDRFVSKWSVTQTCNFYVNYIYKE